MDLRQLRYFLAVADARNITRAAEQLNISQPPLSRALRDLQADLGVQLFVPGQRPLTLTEAGRFLAQRARQMLAARDEAIEGVSRLARGEARFFGLGFVGSVLYGLLPTLVQRFAAAVPDADLTLIELTTFQQGEALRTGRIDVGVGRLELATEGLRRQVLMREPLVLAAPHGWAVAGDAPLALDAALATRLPLLLYPARPRPSFADQVLEQLDALGVRPPRVQEVGDIQIALGLVAAGLGLTLVPATVAGLRPGDVAYRALTPSAPGAPVPSSPVVITTRAEDGSPRLARFLRLATTLAHELAGSPPGPVGPV